MLNLLHDAGWPIWPLLLTSIVALALMIERGLALRRARIAPAGLEAQVLAMAGRDEISDDALDRLARHSPLGVILAEVVRWRGATPEQLRMVVEDAGREVAFVLSKHIEALGTIAVVAPLMGLFGTLVGMIEIFGSYAPAAGDPAALASGIAIALYNTGFGILVAIPALIAHRTLRSRVDSLLFDMENAASRCARRLGFAV
jgi:biopolymer transport protein ExbB